jgi:PilZ domain-containing protein
MAEPTDSRRHERFRGTLTVQVVGDGTQRFATLYEISTGGAFLEVSPLPAVGAWVAITVVEGATRTVLPAEVRYRLASEVGPRGLEGVGVAWGALGPAETALLDRLILRAQAGKPLRG